MRKAIRSSTGHSRAIVAAALTCALILVLAAVAWAAPTLTIDPGPAATNDTTPTFRFTTDGVAVECAIAADQEAPLYAPCSDAAAHTPAAPLADGAYVFWVRATDDQLDPAEQSQPFSVDTVDPPVSVVSGPAEPIRDSTPQFGFTAESGATVECSVDQGTPAFAPCTSPYTAAPLADGPYTFRVRATDDAGNQASDTRSFSVDTAAPPVSVTSGPAGPTSDTTPQFGFTAEAGATVQCSLDQGVPVFAPCASPYAAALLADGAYTFRVQATDAAGNTAVATRAFTVDTAAPAVSVSSGPTGPTRDSTPSFGFAAEAGATVQCSVDQGTPAYGPCSGAAAHTPAAPLADGPYTFRVRATDRAGNQASDTRTFSVDTTPPAVSISSGPAGPTNDRTPQFGFAVDPGATVECSLDQGTPAYGPCASATTHTPAAPLSDGTYFFRVRGTDGVGNAATASRRFSVDSLAPSLSIDSGPEGDTSDSTPTFGFAAEAGASVECSLDHGTPAYGPCTSATTHVVGTALADGTYTFRVRATDAVDHEAIAARTFTVDTVAPSLSIGFGPSGATSDTTPLFGFTAEAGATVECSIDQGTPAYGPCASATTHAAVAPLADGDYLFRVRATDRAGNQRDATRAFTVDTVPETPGPEAPGPTPRTPPVTTPVTPTPTAPQLLSPFPLVRISGTLTATGARIRLLSVRAPSGALVRVTVTPACASKRQSLRRCRVLQAAGTVGRRDLISFRGLERPYRSGTVIVVRVWRADRIGKYTRFTIVRGKAPRRVDQCLVPAATHGSRCPTG